MTRLEAEFVRREAPPSYGQLIAQGLIPPVEDFPVYSASQVSARGRDPDPGSRVDLAPGQTVHGPRAEGAEERPRQVRWGARPGWGNRLAGGGC